MLNHTLTARNTYLTEMLRQAGLDAEARDVAERIQTVLTDEIHHRMKNMLTMVTAIVRQSIRASVGLPEAEVAISLRLLAMAKAHDLLLKADWKASALLDVIHGAIDQHNTSAGRILIHGDDIQINSAAILPLTLTLNELCTNAIKYGSLSKDAGRVNIRCSTHGSHFTLHWVESGGSVIEAPTRKGFGTRLIEDALPRQLGGTGHLAFAPNGVEFELVIPLDQLRPVPMQPIQKETPTHG